MSGDEWDRLGLPELRPTIIDATVASRVILHAPHGSTVIPAAFRSDFVVDDAAIERELLALTDHAVDRMVRHALEMSTASAVIAQVSRLVVDVERFPSDEEEMNEVGMGVLYTHGAWGDRIREVPDQSRTKLMAHFGAYSQVLEQLADRALDQHGWALIIDVHSFATRALHYELHAADARPPLCVGYDEMHMTAARLEQVREAFADFEQVDNEPFAGAYVPLKHYGQDGRVQAVMLEVRRDQYMDEEMGDIDECAIRVLGDGIARLAGRGV